MSQHYVCDIKRRMVFQLGTSDNLPSQFQDTCMFVVKDKCSYEDFYELGLPRTVVAEPEDVHALYNFLSEIEEPCHFRYTAFGEAA